MIVSQGELHGEYGGIVPEIAARKHVEALTPAIREALFRADVTFWDLDGVAATLLVGHRLLPRLDPSMRRATLGAGLVVAAAAVFLVVLVVPGVRSGTPAVMMMRWPGSAKFSSAAMRQAFSTMSSRSSASSVSTQ